MSEKKEEKKEVEEKSDQSIETLPGVGAATAEKLKEANYDNLMSLAVASPGDLTETAGVSEAVARKMINVARNRLDMGFETGEDLLKKREQIIKISTGCKAFDEMLGGGIETGAVTETYGAYGSGKTSLAHQLAVNVQLPIDKGGAKGIAVWIDSEGTLRPEYLKGLAEAKGLDPKKALKNFRGVRAFNSDHQTLLAEKIEDLIKQGLKIKLVIVDSLMSHYRSEFIGRGTLAARQQKLNKHVHQLLKLAHQYNIAIYITNQVMSKPDTFFGDPTEAIGGHVLHHACLTGDSLIQLSDGTITPIEKLRGPTSLVSMNLSKDLKNIMSFCDYGSIRRDIKQIYEIWTNSKIKASPLHKFFRLNGFDVEEVEARDIKEDDYIACVNNINVEGVEQTLPKVDVKEMVTVSSEGSNLIRQDLINLGLTREKVCENLNVNRRQFRRILNQGYATDKNNMTLLVQQGVREQVYEFLEPYTSNKFREIIVPEILSVELAQVLGYFLGDGTIDRRGLGFKDERLEVLQVYNNLFENLFNLSGTISKVKDKNCYNLAINSVVVRDLFNKVRDNLFEYISRSPNEHIRAFIKGFTDAEGYISKKRPTLTIGQKDEKVLIYMQLLLSRLGIRSVLYKSVRDKIFYVLQLDGQYFLRFAEQIKVSASDKLELMNKWINYCVNDANYTMEMFPVKRKLIWNLLKQSGLFPSRFMRSRPETYEHVTKETMRRILSKLDAVEITDREFVNKLEFLKLLLHGDVSFERVKKIELKENNEPLFDISVPVVENYIANGFVVHNSTYRIYLRRGKKGTRVAKLVDAPAMPDNECIFIVTNEGIKDV